MLRDQTLEALVQGAKTGQQKSSLDIGRDTSITVAGSAQELSEVMGSIEPDEPLSDDLYESYEGLREDDIFTDIGPINTGIVVNGASWGWIPTRTEPLAFALVLIVDNPRDVVAFSAWQSESMTGAVENWSVRLYGDVAVLCHEADESEPEATYIEPYYFLPDSDEMLALVTGTGPATPITPTRHVPCAPKKARTGWGGGFSPSVRMARFRRRKSDVPWQQFGNRVPITPRAPSRSATTAVTPGAGPATGGRPLQPTVRIIRRQLIHHAAMSSRRGRSCRTSVLRSPPCRLSGRLKTKTVRWLSEHLLPARYSARCGYDGLSQVGISVTPRSTCSLWTRQDGYSSPTPWPRRCRRETSSSSAIRSSSTRSPWRYTGGAGRRSLSTDSEPTDDAGPGRGVFLTETRRMLPDVRRFISHQKLRSSGSATESPRRRGQRQSLVHQVAACKNVAGFCPTAKPPLWREMSNFSDTRTSSTDGFNEMVGRSVS